MAVSTYLDFEKPVADLEKKIAELEATGGAAVTEEVGKLREKADFGYGWNAQTNEFADLFKHGVIDPAKVVRTALEDAASVAGLLITTEAMVAERPKKEAAPAMPAGM